jgi:hypothetical protein
MTRALLALLLLACAVGADPRLLYSATVDRGFEIKNRFPFVNCKREAFLGRGPHVVDANDKSRTPSNQPVYTGFPDAVYLTGRGGTSSSGCVSGVYDITGTAVVAAVPSEQLKPHATVAVSALFASTSAGPAVLRRLELSATLNGVSQPLLVFRGQPSRNVFVQDGTGNVLGPSATRFGAYLALPPSTTGDVVFRFFVNLLENNDDFGFGVFRIHACTPPPAAAGTFATPCLCFFTRSCRLVNRRFGGIAAQIGSSCWRPAWNAQQPPACLGRLWRRSSPRPRTGLAAAAPLVRLCCMLRTCRPMSSFCSPAGNGHLTRWCACGRPSLFCPECGFL